MQRTPLATLALIALVAVGCGGGGDGSGDESADPLSTAADVDSGGADSGDAGLDPVAGSTDGVDIDVSALTTAPINGVIARSADGASAVAPAIDTCAALSAEQVSTIAGEVDEASGFGSTYDFSAEDDGASCLYRADTHVIRLTVGDAGVVSADPSGSALVRPIASGDVTVTPWATDASVTIFSEDSFDLETEFAAHAAAGDLGIIVSNAGGTGIDGSNSGELWARLAAAAAEGAPDAPRVEGAEAGATEVDPCDVWTVEEIDGFLPGKSVSSNTDITRASGCLWTGPDYDVEVGVDVQPIAGSADFEGAEPVTDGSAVMIAPGYARPYVVSGDNAILVSVRVDQVSETAAAIALAENLAARLG